MRTITLGVLIVAGGTLAALPFRRQSPSSDAPPPPKHATGPITTMIEDNRPTQSPQTIRREQQEISRATEIVSSVYADVPPVVPAPRRVPGPLTYADLAVPLQQLPAEIRRRSAKPAAVLPSAIGRGQILDVPPAMQAMPLTQQSIDGRSASPFQDPAGDSVLSQHTTVLAPIATAESLANRPPPAVSSAHSDPESRQRPAESIQQVSQRQGYAATSAATEQTFPTPGRVQMPEPLPAPTPDPAKRVRHWIRQPK